MAADVVEVPQAQARGDFGLRHRRDLRNGGLRGIPRALSLHDAQYGLHPRAAPAGPPLPRGPVPRAVRLPLYRMAQHGESEARIRGRHLPAAAAALLLPRRRRVHVLGHDPRQSAPRLPAQGRDVLLPRLRSARPGHVLAHSLWRPHLAFDRPDRRQHLLRARGHHRRHRRLLRRQGRSRRPAPHRDRAVAAAYPALAGTGLDHAAVLEPAAGLFRHHGDPRPDGLDRARPLRPLETAVVARGGLCRRRPAHGRQAAS